MAKKETDTSTALGTRKSTVRDDEARHEARFRAAVRKFNRSLEANGAHFILDAEYDPVVQVANQVFQKAARRKLN